MVNCKKNIMINKEYKHTRLKYDFMSTISKKDQVVDSIEKRSSLRLTLIKKLNKEHAGHRNCMDHRCRPVWQTGSQQIKGKISHGDCGYG